MKKLVKSIVIIFGVISAIIVVFLIITFINHRIHLQKEDKLFIPSGQMVEVNDHDMHIYTEGQGDLTLVFMSGGGTSSPTLDFKSLYSLLSHTYRIAVVEKAGYGFSEITDIDRDIDTILSETRKALSKAGISGPYILCPHSMSGIEALYWAQTYPDEIRAIIGLDMSIPESYEDYSINMPIMNLSSFAAKIGIIRWIPGISESDAIKYGSLTEEEKDLYRAVFYRRTATKSMLNEVKNIKANASKVKEGGIPSVPILMFSSNGQGTGWKEEEWKNFQYDYMEQVEDSKLIDLDCSHYVHNIEQERIVREIEIFME